MAPTALRSADELTRALFPTRPSQPFTTLTVSVHKLTDDTLDSLVVECSGVLGIAAVFGKQRMLKSIVLATSCTVLHLTNFKPNKAQRRKLTIAVFGNPRLKLVGFPMDAIAYGLFTDANVLLSNGVELGSLADPPVEHKAIPIFTKVLGHEYHVDRSSLSKVFSTSMDPSISAIISARESRAAALRPSLTLQLQTAPLVSTKALRPEDLQVLSRTHRDSALLDTLKPDVQNNDVVGKAIVRKGELHLELGRYKTRLRPNADQKQLIDIDGYGKLDGRTKKVNGRQAIVALTSAAPSSFLKFSVTTIGKDPLTSAESVKEEFLLELLQRKACVRGNLVYRAIWFPSNRPSRGLSASLSGTTQNLNASQSEAVRAVVAQLPGSSVDVHVIRGPPGTGKTTVIAACVEEFRAMNQTAWLVAQSNVAVKNIAEKLARIDFLDFKLLVSKEFHYDWHEGLYEKLEHNLIRSDEFLKTTLEVERKLKGSKIILCTLSMLSNGNLHSCGFPTAVPIETLVVDEASQIELGDYLPVVKLFEHTLRRLVFVGDDKQLAPYGHEHIPKLRSVFEVKYHSARAIMLDVCYRLPVPICRFISRHVYGGKLKSQHVITARGSCQFVDVSDGTEKKKGTSWTNEQEANICIALALKLHKSHKHFRIITPYDPQRDLLEKKLKASGIRSWEDRVFCVDSFQGNEDEYIIISVVRTTKPGFMANLRRTNVMLTRCQKGMFICASKAFLTSPAAKDTLVGKMAEEWGADGWITVQDVYNNRIWRN